MRCSRCWNVIAHIAEVRMLQACNEGSREGMPHGLAAIAQLKISRCTWSHRSAFSKTALHLITQQIHACGSSLSRVHLPTVSFGGSLLVRPF